MQHTVNILTFVFNHCGQSHHADSLPDTVTGNTAHIWAYLCFAEQDLQTIKEFSQWTSQTESHDPLYYNS